MSTPTIRDPGPSASRASRATMPVPHAMSMAVAARRLESSDDFLRKRPEQRSDKDALIDLRERHRREQLHFRHLILLRVALPNLSVFSDTTIRLDALGAHQRVARRHRTSVPGPH
jgi:hypothetical protein